MDILRHPVLDRRFITAPLKQFFGERRSSTGRRPESAATAEAFEEIIVGAVQAAENAEAEQRIQTEFDRLLTPERPQGATDEPSYDDYLFRIRLMWAIFNGKSTMAVKLLHMRLGLDAESGGDAVRTAPSKASNRVVVNKRKRSCEGDGAGTIGTIGAARRIQEPVVHGPLKQIQVEGKAMTTHQEPSIRESSLESLIIATPSTSRVRFPTASPVSLPRISQLRTSRRVPSSLEDLQAMQDEPNESKVVFIPKSKKRKEGGPWQTRPAKSSVFTSLDLSHCIHNSQDIQNEQHRPTRPKSVRFDGSQSDELVKIEPDSETVVTLRTAGISSRMFARVMRLVAGICPIGTPVRTAKLPRPSRRPPVWAQSRQELCEALPYYRSFQSSLYMHKRVGYAYLLDGYPSPRDAWAHNGRVIISHGGGQCVRTIDHRGQSTVSLQADQADSDARVDTLIQCAKNKTPIILIAGEAYAKLPWDLGCAYAVLGWYWVSATWVEAEYPGRDVLSNGKGYFHRYKIRFDWVDGQGAPWWESVSGTAADVSSTAPRYQASVVHAGLADQARSEDPALQHQLADPSLARTRNDRDRTDRATGQVDYITNDAGLLTPPITPPERNAKLELSSLVHHEQCTLSERDLQTRLWAEQDIAKDGPYWPMRVPIREHRHVPGSAMLWGHAETEHIDDGDVFVTDTCKCGQPSIRLYGEGAICLNPLCTLYWAIRTQRHTFPIPPGFSLTYTDAFLLPRPTHQLMKTVPFDIAPPSPLGLPAEATEDAGGRTLWRGWVCPDCGRANCRFRWEVWECRACHKLLAPLDPAKTIHANQLLPANLPYLGDAIICSTARITHSTILVLDHSITVHSYRLPYGAGTIYHVTHSDLAKADIVFDAYQRAAAVTKKALFERGPLTGAAIKGQMLSQQFAVNSGATYKYNVKSASLTFDESPGCVMDALDIITECVEKVLEKRIEFNEVLSILYREGQKMSWHDDGEDGLGPIVASLSLGSPANMSWRPKPTQEKRLAPHLFGRQAQVSRTNEATALSLTLSHGDIIIMQGRSMQLLYDHRVIPQGFRVAATARAIGKGH